MCTPTLCTEQRQCTCVNVQFHLLGLLTSHAIEAGSAHIHMCIVCVTVWHNAGVSFPSWGCLTQAHALWPCSAASSCSFYTFPAVFSLTRVQLGNMCKSRQLHIFKLYCAKNPTHPDLAASYFCHLGFVFVSFCFFLCHLSFVFVKILLMFVNYI